MVQVAKFTTPADAFAVGRAIGNDSSITVELERLVPTDGGMIPFIWVWGDDVDGYRGRLEDQPGIDDVDELYCTGSGSLLRVDWNNEMSQTIRELFELDFTLLSGIATGESWRFEIRFPSGRVATGFQTYLREHEIPHQLESIHPLKSAESPDSFGLTPEQREALTVAYQAGYFREPRAATLEKVAERLNISPSAASGRLRRGHAALIEHTLM
jgi:hypothetical protein